MLQVWRNLADAAVSKLHLEGSNPSACIGNSKFVGVAQFGRRAGLRSRLLKVQVLSPTSVFRRRSSIGRARACQARGREFKPPRRLLMFEASTLGRVDFRRGAANPVRAVRFRQRAPTFNVPKWRNRQTRGA